MYIDDYEGPKISKKESLMNRFKALGIYLYVYVNMYVLLNTNNDVIYVYICILMIMRDQK
jgi:hypothetical protein